MAKLKNQDIGEKLVGIGLNKDQINIFLSSINDKYWKDSIKIYKKLNIIRKDLDSQNEIYALLKLDKKSYDVNLEVANKKLISFCNCSHREDAKGWQHIGAVLISKLLQEKENSFNVDLKMEIKEKKKGNDLDYFKKLFLEEKKKDKQNMIYFNFEDFDLHRQILKIERGLVLKSGNYGEPMKFYGKKFDSHNWKISKNVKKVLNFISEGDSYSNYDSSRGFSKSRFRDINTDLMMPTLKNLFFEEQEIILNASFSQEDFEIVWDILRKEKDTYILEPFFVSGRRKISLLNLNLFELGCTTLWVFDTEKRIFYKYKGEENLDRIKNIIRFPKQLEFNSKELKKFFSEYYQKVINDFKINVSNDLKRESRSIVPKTKLYLEKAGSSIKIKIRFEYLGIEVDYFSRNKELVVIDNDVIYDISRDFEEEERIVELLNEFSVVTHEEKDEFAIDTDLINFVSEDLPEIAKKGISVLGEEGLFTFKISKAKGKMEIGIKQNNDWFEIKGKARFGNDEIDIQKVLEAIFQNKRFVELTDDKKAIIPKKWVNQLKSYSGFFDFSKEVRLSKNHISIVESLSQISTNVKLDPYVKKAINTFSKFNEIKPVPLPKKLNAELREYQKVGYSWLSFLRDHQFNGILADDMGLGKTLQTIGILQKLREEKDSLRSSATSKTKNSGSPFLVVVPTSLAFNWKNELKKFTEGMKVYLHHGQKRFSGKKFEEALEKNELILTTYGVLRNDLEQFKQIEFEYIVLDEAHVIKNPMSIAAKSVCQLKGKNKLVISGTPIQNNLTELWSLFNFLNPGYLGGYDFFRENFVIPIEREHDKNVSSSLKKLIRPFLLRRTKKVISEELPPKTEMILESTFSQDEKEIYENWKDYYKHEIRTSIKEKGLNKSKMKILEGLTKLRQICLHPKMIDPQYEGQSAKFDLLMMQIEKIISEGHKILVFSSFVKLLTIAKEDLEKRGIKYSYLDGKTKNREKIVSGFQDSEEAQVFLISIKAGGLGLNLTSADYVFIADPWWNPAVEMQAMDRAHRIGQSKKVFVYKMIAKETIEDKILELQKSKQKLVEDLIVEEESLVKSMDMSDIRKIFG